MSDLNLQREIIVCVTCKGKPSVATAFPEHIEEAKIELGKMPNHRGHSFQVYPGHPEDHYHGAILAVQPRGFLIYGSKEDVQGLKGNMNLE